MNCENIKGWFPLLITFRLAFRFITIMDSLGIVLFYNIPLFMKLPLTRFTIPGYILLIVAVEVYLIWTLRKDFFPIKLMFAYFGVVLLFELPYATLSSDSVGLKLFVIPWYLSALIGFVMVLKRVRNSLGRA